MSRSFKLRWYPPAGAPSPYWIRLLFPLLYFSLLLLLNLFLLPVLPFFYIAFLSVLLYLLYRYSLISYSLSFSSSFISYRTSRLASFSSFPFFSPVLSFLSIYTVTYPPLPPLTLCSASLSSPFLSPIRPSISHLVIPQRRVFLHLCRDWGESGWWIDAEMLAGCVWRGDSTEKGIKESNDE